MVFSACTLLASCEHEHSGSSYGKDATHHWTVCDKCDEAIDTVEHTLTGTSKDAATHTLKCDVCGYKSTVLSHTFDEGVMVTEPSPAGDGLKEFTCTGCGFVRSATIEYVPKTTVDEDDFYDIINLVGVSNYEIRISGDIALTHDTKTRVYQYDGTSIYDGAFYWTQEGSTVYQYYKSSQSGEWLKTTSDDVEERYLMRRLLINDLVHWITLNDFTYIEGTKPRYQATNVQSSLFCDIGGCMLNSIENFDRVQLYFEDDRLVTIHFTEGDYTMAASIKYGTADFTVPTVE